MRFETLKITVTSKIPLSKLILGIAIALLSFFAYSGDDPVNCRQEVVDQIAIYAGQSSCLVEIDYDYYWLSEYVYPQTNPKKTIYQNVYVSSRMKYLTLTCIANVPFSYYSPVYQTVCDYTPAANFSRTPYYGLNPGSTTIALTDSSSDRDGSIVQRDLRINGVKKATVTGNQTLTGVWPLGFTAVDGQAIVVEVTVLDDGGYLDSISHTFKVKVNPCEKVPSPPACNN